MSRDVAYRNGYLPLYAGAELVRRSGALTQFPADNLIGTLPVFQCSSNVVYSTPGHNPPPVGVHLDGLALYSVFYDIYSAYILGSPAQCEQAVSVIETSEALAGALPFVPEGYATPDLSDPADWHIMLDTPGVSGGLGFSVGYFVGGVSQSAGSVVVIKDGTTGIVTVDTSNLLAIPATFSASGMQQLNVTQTVTLGATGTWWPMFNAHLTPTARAWVECIAGGPCGTTVLWDDTFVGTPGGQPLSAHAPDAPSGGAYTVGSADIVVDNGVYSTNVGTFVQNQTSVVQGGRAFEWALEIPVPPCYPTCNALDDFYLDILDADGNPIAVNGFSVYVAGAGSEWSVILDGSSQVNIPIPPDAPTRLVVSVNGGFLTCRIENATTGTALAGLGGICTEQTALSMQRGVFGVRRQKASRLTGRVVL